MNKIVSKMFPLLGVLVIGISIAVNYHLGFYTVSEAEMYIPFFLSDKPFFYKLYYYPTTDLYYRAREISNIFNYIDTYFLLWSTKLGFPHFLSVIYYSFLSVIYFVLLFFTQKVFGKKRIGISVLFSIVYLTLPALFLSGMYFRPSKMLIALGIVLSYVVVYVLQKNYWKPHIFVSVLSGVLLTLVMGISDEQGIFYSFLFAQMGIIASIVTKRKSVGLLSVGLIVGNGLLWIYRTYIGPSMVLAITGLSAQPWGIEDLVLFQPKDVLVGYQLLGTYLHYFAGNNYIFFSILLCIPIVRIVTHHFSETKKMGMYSRNSGLRPSLLSINPSNHLFNSFGAANLSKMGIHIFFYLLFMSILLSEFALFFHVLSMRHPVILWPEFTIIYYPIPFYTFLFVGIFMYCMEQMKHISYFYHMLIVVLILWIATNTASLFGYSERLTSPQTKTSVYYGYAWHFLPALKELNKPIEYFNLDHEDSVRALREKLGK